MKKHLAAYIVLALTLAACIHPEKEKEAYLKKADFDPETRVLSLTASGDIDTALHQIIFLSGIREGGYGVLLNIGGAKSRQEIDSLKHKFRKLDINAVHDFDIQPDRPVDKHIEVAIEGAEFIWLFTGDKIPDVRHWINDVASMDGMLVVESK